MTHNNRGRIAVALGGNWRLYTNSAPAGCTMLGTITRGETETGALAQTEAGIYSMVNARVFRSLDQRKVDAALSEARATHGGPGRGQGLKAADGATGLKRTNITLDDDSKAILRAFGGGDLSLGIRRAAAHLKSSGAL
jgi:hypothetical protein